MRSYTKASLDCLRMNGTEVEAFADAQRKTASGYCLAAFPSTSDCVDMIAFFYRCDRIDKNIKNADEIGKLMIAIFFLLFVCLSCCSPR